MSEALMPSNPIEPSPESVKVAREYRNAMSALGKSMMENGSTPSVEYHYAQACDRALALALDAATARERDRTAQIIKEAPIRDVWLSYNDVTDRDDKMIEAIRSPARGQE